MCRCFNKAEFSIYDGDPHIATEACLDHVTELVADNSILIIPVRDEAPATKCCFLS